METVVNTEAVKDRLARIDVAQVVLTRVWKVCGKDTDVFATALKRMAKSEFRRKVRGKDIDLSLLPPDYGSMEVSEIDKWTAEPETRRVVEVRDGQLLTSEGRAVDIDLVDSIDLLDMADRVEYLYRMQEKIKGHED